MGFFTILAIIALGLAFFLQYLYNKDKLHGYGRYFFLVLVILSAILVIRQEHEKNNLNDKLLGLTQHKIIPLPNKTRKWLDKNTNLIYTDYFFRSQYPGGIRDISITLKFNTPIIAAKYQITGAMVTDQDSRISVDTGSAGLSYFTGYLSEGNDILIEVVSRKPINIISSQLSP